MHDILELLEGDDRLQEEEDENEDDAPRLKHVLSDRLCAGTLGNRASGGITPLEAWHTFRFF